jgi:hypothetical protein
MHAQVVALYREPLARQYWAARAAFDSAGAGGDGEVPWPKVDRYNAAIRALLSAHCDGPGGAEIHAAQAECLASRYVREQFLEGGDTTAQVVIAYLLRFAPPKH